MPADEALRAELVALADADRRSGRATTDERHAARLWEILDDYECWPGRRLVGEDGSDAAWRLAQHALFDPGLQRRCLEMLELAVEAGDAPATHYAYLLDRVCMADGRDQVYGSQFVPSDDGATVVPFAIDDPAGVDDRRRRVGLPPLAEQTHAMQARWDEAARSSRPMRRDRRAGSGR
ncbi:MAG: DUF6624 domain-containing protein [Acidimicrobiia bacterium]